MRERLSSVPASSMRRLPLAHISDVVAIGAVNARDDRVSIVAAAIVLSDGVRFPLVVGRPWNDAPNIISLGSVNAGARDQRQTQRREQDCLPSHVDLPAHYIQPATQC